MVNIGDTVLATIRTFVPSSAAFFDQAAGLQSRLQQAGFRVLRVDDSGISWFNNYRYGDLLVTLQPQSSAYGNANDVASIVAGAAYAAGYGGAESFSGNVIAQAGRASDEYKDNLDRQRPPDNSNPLGMSASTIALIGFAVVTLFVLKK